MKRKLFIAFCLLVLFANCRQVDILPEDTGKRLTIAEAKAYFNKKYSQKITGKRLATTGDPNSGAPEIEDFDDVVELKTPLWNSAYEKLLQSGQQAISVPLDIPDASTPPYVLVDDVNGNVVPFSSLNYLHMYKDQAGEVQTRWITYMPDSLWLYGSRSAYYGNVIIRDWNGNILQNVSIEREPGITREPSGAGWACLIFEREVPNTCNEETWRCYAKICVNIPDMEKEPGDPIDPTDPNGPGGGGGGGRNPGGNGGNGGGNNPGTGYGGGGGGGAPTLGCNPDPNYVVPDYPAPNGQDWVLPCSGGPEGVPIPVPIGLPTTQAVTLLSSKINLSAEQWEFMNENQIILDQLADYLTIHPDKVDFIDGLLYEGSEGMIDASQILDYLNSADPPLILPKTWTMEISPEWYEAEDLFGLVELEMQQQGIPNTDPVPESYYRNGVRIDMQDAKPTEGKTAKGAPRNRKYFWREFLKDPRGRLMLDQENLDNIKKGDAPIVNDKWIEYNKTAKAYKGEKLVHHHHGQGRYAYALPEKVHLKWNRVLHVFRNGGKLSGLKNRMNTLASGVMVLQGLVDIFTGNPDSWINWFQGADKTGVLYYHPFNKFYFEMYRIDKIKDTSGKVVRAIVEYDAYAGSVWDEDERRYMGVLKVGTFWEEIDVINKITIGHQELKLL
ncbi:hypothetical protein [Sphingobacterium spiritivorum]|uniref:hypothetical protein n=1 Tax=Sphingobacterium spiritivorum TaxID=258 RepID=UPI003DA4B168